MAEGEEDRVGIAPEQPQRQDTHKQHRTKLRRLALDDLTCFVSNDILHSPVTLSCGHSFSLLAGPDTEQ